jgi:hypothetical protein
LKIKKEKEDEIERREKDKASFEKKIKELEDQIRIL